MKSFIGKRILVFWTTKAFNQGSDWPSFRVVDADDNIARCVGVDSPDGCPHDGSRCLIKISETLNIIEWKDGK